MKKYWDYYSKGMIKFWEIESKTVKGKKYRVSQTKEGLECNCLDFLIRNRECKHIDEVKQRSNIE